MPEPLGAKRIISPLMRRRIANFRANRRGRVALIIFSLTVVLSLAADLIANDKPLLISHDGTLYWPIFEAVPETTYGGFLPTEADYQDPEVVDLITAKGWIIRPPVPYSYRRPAADLITPAPSPPDHNHWLGTDAFGRDIVARLIHGYRNAVVFGLGLTLIGTAIGVVVGVLQGYFGGWIDLIGQRMIEIWNGVPVLFLLIILSSMVQPNIWWLMLLIAMFSWTALVGVVRAEVLRTRNLDHVRAAAALGLPNHLIMFRHILPNAMVATLTLLPFLPASAIGTLASLDFIGFGLPPGSASLGEMIKQGKDNLQAPWIGISVFVLFSSLFVMLVFIGEAMRDAFDPRRSPL